jgi:hypothetical protein
MTTIAAKEGEAAPAVNPAVQELARVLREGLESRRFQGSGAFGTAPSAVASSETWHGLHNYADLLAFPAVAKPGPLAWLVRFLRRLCKPLIRPWLAIQTEFNRLTLEALQDLHHEIRVLREELDRRGGAVQKADQPWCDPPADARFPEARPVVAEEP